MEEKHGRETKLGEASFHGTRKPHLYSVGAAEESGGRKLRSKIAADEVL